ncbi:non-hydrolyzing UDP-N-acetylglucosamine 2-epimerase [Ketobacter sp.]
MKVLVIFGTRPEVIKLAPVILELQRRLEQGVELLTCLTGQHREMAYQALSVFKITPDADLDLMQPGQTLPDLTARLMTAISMVLETHRPDVVVVQGDTSTAFVGGLAAFYAGIPVAHVEAGLRTGDMQSPFPEEMNRVMLSRVARWHFAPTERAANALLEEGIDKADVFITGNTVVDAIGIVRQQWNPEAIQKRLGFNVDPGKCVLVTTHRRENFGEGLQNILGAVTQLAVEYSELTFVFPVHLNPSVHDKVHKALAGIPNIKLLGPINFEESLYLQSISCLILTDSGGIQEEAPSFSVPVIVMREHTERREGVDAGFGVLAGQTKSDILNAAHYWLSDRARRDTLAELDNPYGDGRAALRIIDILAGSSDTYEE